MKSIKSASKILQAMEQGDPKSRSAAKNAIDIKANKRGPFKLKLGVIPSHEVPISMKLCYENNLQEALPDKIYTIDLKHGIVIGKNGMVTFNIKFKEASMSHANKRFVFQFASEYTGSSSHTTQTRAAQVAVEESDHEHLAVIAPLTSVGMLVISHRLIVRLDLHDTGTDMERQDVWFKDEGGRDNCIDVHVSLIDAKDALVTHRSVPLKISLNYATGEPVLKQDLLIVLPESTMSIEKSGTALIKVRINDVSKNHQRQQFHLSVAPDTSNAPLLNDISADRSQNIEVKSKRTKRSRESLSGTAAQPAAAGVVIKQQPGVVNSSSSTSSAQFAVGASVSNVASNLMNLRDTSSSRYSDPLAQSFGGNNSSGVQHNRYDDSSTLVQNYGKATLFSGDDLHLFDVGMSLQSTANGRRSSIGTSSGIATNTIISGLSAEQAITHILSWSDSVMSRLQAVRWRPVGYEQRRDGTMDKSRPMYAFQNPNDLLEELADEFGAVSATMQSSLALLNGGGKTPSKGGTKRQKTSLSGAKNSAAASQSGLQNGFSAQQHLLSDAFSNNTPLLFSQESKFLEEGGSSAVSGFQQHPRSGSISNEQTWGHMVDNVEQRDPESDQLVHFIIALPFKTGSSSSSSSGSSNSSSSSGPKEELGFPAFDADQTLMGFYQERQDDRNHTTVIVYTPLSQSRIAHSAEDKVNAETFLSELMGTNSSAVYSMPKCAYNLEGMKQDAMVHYWLSEVSLEDDLM